MKYKSFRDQFIECKDNGTCCTVTICLPFVPKGSHFGISEKFEVNICAKYMEQCHSGICLADREKSGD